MHNNTLERIFEGTYDSFFLIAGPCAVESMTICDEVAGQMKEICSDLNIPYIFKGSIKKANRTKLGSFSGIGDEVAGDILQKVKVGHDLAITTDIHETTDVAKVSGFIDLLQIPAFLCRQTELLIASGNSGRAVNIKKGQFMSGAAMIHAAEKVRSTGNEQVMLTERGNSFGYQELVVDARNVDVMSKDAITIMDVTHATQRPNQTTGVSGGNPEEIELLGRIGLSAGAKGIFMEVHPDPQNALSDASSMLTLSKARGVLERWKTLSTTLRSLHA